MISGLINRKDGDETTSTFYIASELKDTGSHSNLVDAAPSGEPAMTSARMYFDGLTRVELTWVESELEFWIRFGHVSESLILDGTRRIVSFQPGAVFALVRWASNDYGTITSRIDILRAVAPGSAYQTLPFVRPGGEILLQINGWPKVEDVLRHVDAIESVGIDPAEVDPDHWRHVGHWMNAGEAPHPYTTERHRAWLRRREIRP